MEDALAKPRNVTHTLYKLYSWLEMGTIDLSPEFQRDAILNFYIPPIIFSCKKLDDKRFMRVCIDGKQRLTSIKRFIDNEIPHIKLFNGNNQKYYYKKPKNTKSEVITQFEREVFDCSEFVCVEYYDLNLEQEQEIFSRVQLGMPLTPAEKLQAISSPMSEYAHQIFSDYPSITNIMDVSRGRPFQLITQSLHMIETQPPLFRATPTTISKYLKEDRPVPRKLLRTSKHVYDTLDSLIKADVELLNQNNKLAPIEFVFLCFMIAKYPDLSISQFQYYITAMKKLVRQKHDDIRFNGKVYETLKQFVDNMADRIGFESQNSFPHGYKRIKREIEED
ncbi:13285_t:CDS:2 [Ambispora gerdemannii]|uniref:13285_t:CDS:1 n=1 Tax=Ambispora gerdemannii TaxID=144530 RepID=A0A9N9B3I3_9GLOM|nr:13285_t:CDS:2 [Ambispora gerdemannii]